MSVELDDLRRAIDPIDDAMAKMTKVLECLTTKLEEQDARILALETFVLELTSERFDPELDFQEWSQWQEAHKAARARRARAGH